MSLFAIGINHTTASVELREKVAFSPEKLSKALKQLEVNPHVVGVVILSTCNRTEIYAEMAEEDHDLLVEWLVAFHHLEYKELENSLYLYRGMVAVKHLMCVACGLDSLILGEPQILGQVKKAYADAKQANAVSGVIERLFQKTFSVAKRVRTETEIGGSAVSIAYAACLLAKQIFESISQSTVLLVGAGETIELVTKHLASHGCQKIIVANRTRERAQELVEQFGCDLIDFDIIELSQIPDYLYKADIIISSTASPLPIIGKGMVESALKKRRRQPMLFIDIAVPRDVESQVGELNDAYLYSVDDLQSIVNHNIEQRKIEAIQAEMIIDDEQIAFMNWLHSLLAVESIREYRCLTNQIRKELLEKSLQALAAGGNAEKLLIELSNKLTNKLIHAPTKSLQVAAERGEQHTLSVIKQSLGLHLNK